MNTTTGLPFKNIVNISGDCYENVPVSTPGIWNIEAGGTMFQHSFFRFSVQLLMMFFLSHSIHLVLRYLYMPRITSEIMAGILLGPTGFGGWFPEENKLINPPFPNQVMASLSKIGYVLFAFLAGIRMDTSLIPQSGRKALFMGILLFVFPFTMIHSIEAEFDKRIDSTIQLRIGIYKSIGIFVGAITTCQFVGVSHLLTQLRITNSQLGHLALATTLVSELLRFAYSSVLGWLDTLLFVARRSGIQAILFSSLLVIFIVVVLRGLMLWSIRNTPQGKPMKEIYITLVVGVLLTLASLGDSVGTYYLFGPFLLGLVIPAGSPLATSLISKLETVVNGLFIPIILMFCSTSFDLGAFFQYYSKVLTFRISLIGYFLKLIFTFIMGLCFKLTAKDCAAYTLIVNAKGVLEIGIFLSFGNLGNRQLESTSAIFLVFLLSSFSPPIIRLLYDPTKQYIGYKRKCIQYAPDNAPLHILACAHKQDDAVAVLKFLEFSNPTKQSPLVVFGLCLEELVSSFTPLLINHQLGQKVSSSKGSKSQHILDVFNYFSSQLKKLAQVNAFTAISHLKQMHEDICWLAFDKAVSLIVLPFHNKWNSKGQMIHGTTDLRNLNINVLNRAPCSVGILIDRRRAMGLSSIFVTSAVYRMMLLFVGGSDDREALSLALRMAGSPRVQLTVVQFIVSEENIVDRWEAMLDAEALRIMKQELQNGNVKFVEEHVRDGSDTSRIVREMEANLDLVIVGRRHDQDCQTLSGLSQWMEIPELGPLGDILASEDVIFATSVLVVQQQIMKASHSSILN
ncbi:Cation/H(+) antiporter 3 [Linum perenne]